MSTTKEPQQLSDQRKDRLDKLYELREELQIVADADVEYSKYAKEGLRTLREAGYDV